MFKPKHTQIIDLYDKAKTGEKYNVKGWIRFIRPQTNVLFMQIYDGSHAKPLQLIFGDSEDELRKSIEKKAYVGTSISAYGIIIPSPAKGQSIEMKVEKCDIVGEVENPSKFLPSIKGISIETIRNHHDMRPMLRSYQAIYRIRSKLMKIIHDFFHANKFHHLDPNVITRSDCEGAGEVFTITNLLKNTDISSNLLKPTNTNDKTIKLDFSKDMFGYQAYLTVSSQLQLEALCRGMGRVYTTNKSYRAEPSCTRRHMCEFTHLEWEIAFIDLNDLMDFSEDLVTHCIKTVLTECKDDLDDLNSFVSKGIINKLNSLISNKFIRITYKEAYAIIEKAGNAVKKHFPEITELPKYGDDLGSFCERYLTEVEFKSPVIVYNYPKPLKSFYMKQNGEEKDETVACMDMLIPGLGELIGASAREDNYNKLVCEMKHRGISIDPLQWYVDLRKNGSVPTAGAGLGFDRLVSVVTMMEGNIRDATPFPVAFQECFF